MPMFEVGRRATRSLRVIDSDLGLVLNNGGLGTVASAVLCHWFEEVAGDCIRDQLPPGQVTVGTKMDFEHLTLSPAGPVIDVNAELTGCHGRHLSYHVEACDGPNVIGRGHHERVLVDLERFLARARMKSPRPGADAISLTSLAEKPELTTAAQQLDSLWPSFYEGDRIHRRHWRELPELFPEWHLLATNGERLLASISAAPIVWDGDNATLPAGWDGAVELAVSQHGQQPTTTVALAVTVAPEARGHGLSSHVLGLARAVLARREIRALIAPVRPSLKAVYPLVTLEDFLCWQTDCGEPLDPWVRVHRRLGAEQAHVEPRSMVVAGTVSDWERWTGMRFPQSGLYVVPEALAPVRVDADHDEGLYEEPNVWMVHRL